MKDLAAFAETARCCYPIVPYDHFLDGVFMRIFFFFSSSLDHAKQGGDGLRGSSNA